MTTSLTTKTEQINYLKTLAKIAAESKQYANQTETGILNLMITAHDLGISPSKAINGGFYIVNGKVCMSTALMADMIRKAGHSIKIPEWTSQKCVILGIRKDNGDSVKFEYTMEDAVAAGLTSSPTWKKFPKQMLYNRAMSALARTLFPDVIGNSYEDTDEKFDIQNVPSEKRPLEDVTEEVEIITGHNPLTEAQCAQIDLAIESCTDKSVEEKLKVFLRVKSLYDIDQRDFDRVIKRLAQGNSNAA